MTKTAVGQHQLMRTFLPALIAVLLATALLLLGMGVVMDHHLEAVARGMAQRVAPGSSVALDLDLAVEQFALATVLSAHTGDDRDVTEAGERLESAARAYDGWASAAHVPSFTAMAPVVAAFQERVAAATGTNGAVDAIEVDSAVDEITDDLRSNRAVLAAGTTQMLDDIALSQERRRWEEMALMGVLAIGCVVLALGARRREEKVCAVEKESVRSLEKANADLEAFAGRVAHDLRNPLVPILSGSQVIERSDVDERVKRAAERIERSARRLSSMIDMLLDFSRLAAPHEPTACDVAPIVSDVVEGFSDKARTHGVAMVVQCEDVRAACEPIVVASPLQNLVENAFKYGRRADVQPVIEVRGYLRGGMVLIEVEDRGPGLDPHEAENLFRAFQRGVDGGEGVGLGLATARRLVEARGGSIGLRVGRFGGALFQVRLPAEPPSEHREPDGDGKGGVTSTRVQA